MPRVPTSSEIVLLCRLAEHGCIPEREFERDRWLDSLVESMVQAGYVRLGSRRLHLTKAGREAAAGYSRQAG